MSINKSYAVFGLGQYGTAVARELAHSGADVLAVDSDIAIVNNAISEIPYCKCADVTDSETLKELGIGNMDVVIIAMANNLEASVMAIMLCKEAGVENVIVKCANEMHRKIFTKIGADKVVFPESESGNRLAKNLLSSGFVDAIELSEDMSLIELSVKNEWVGKSLIELDLRKKYSINVVAIRNENHLEIHIDPSMKLDKNMHLVVLVNPEKLAKLK